MKRKLLPLLLLLVLLTTGCELLPDAGSKPRERSEKEIFAMNTRMQLTLYGDADGAQTARLSALIFELDRTLSATDPDSALSALNASGVSEDPHILRLTGEAAAVSAETGGALDVTLLPVSRAWGFPTEEYRVVPAGELEALRPLTGMDRIERSDGRVVLPAGMMLDFGALAKGYAAELCRAELEQAGLPGILSLGGNIQTVGTKPDGTPWVVGLQDPADESRYCLSLRITGSKALVSSGDYQRFFLQDGVRYCHILDPKTLAPVQGSLRSVTVVADSGLRADALSTALFVMGREAGERFWREHGGFEAVWIEADGTIWLTPGLQELAGEGRFEVIAP